MYRSNGIEYSNKSINLIHEIAENINTLDSMELGNYFDELYL